MARRGKLSPLGQLLAASDEDRLVLPLAFIEELIGQPLPASARRHAAWWSNSTAHAETWLAAGYRASRSGTGPDEIAFVREDADTTGIGTPSRGRPRVYVALQHYLAESGRQTVDLTFSEIEEILGRDLPASAYEHAAYWSNTSSISYAWREAGYRLTRAGMGPEAVRFVRTGTSSGWAARDATQQTDSAAGQPFAAHVQRSVAAAAAHQTIADPAKSRLGAGDDPATSHGDPDVVLVGCVASKRPGAHAARDLYTSPLFAGRRRRAESALVPWYVLSAEHGLVRPDEVIEAYDRRLADQSAAYRVRWRRKVVARLEQEFGELDGLKIEVHAGAAYLEPLRPLLRRAGAALDHPLAGLRFGEQLAWYSRDGGPLVGPPSDPPRAADPDASTPLAPAPRASYLPMPRDVRREVAEALLGHLAAIDASPPTLSPIEDADEFLREDPFAFLGGVILDQGIVAERAWTGPWLLRERLGHWELDRLADEPQEVARALAAPPALHRMVERMPAAISHAALQVRERYGGDASRIWRGEPKVSEVLDRLRAFDWIGQKKAAMTVEILARHLGVSFAGFESSDIAYDIHVRRVFMRSGVAARDEVAHMVGAARELNPERPGALDAPAWDIGRRWCRPATPACDDCAIGSVCPRLIARAGDVLGM